ncbi:MAG: TonB-dependent receptor [bacterium]
MVAAETGKPILEANIQIPQLSILTRTDRNGEFTLDVGKRSSVRLKVTHVAFESKLVDVALSDPQAEVTIELAERVFISDGTVVTATRTPLLLKDVPVTTDVVTVDEVGAIGATTVDEALELMTGIDVSNNLSGVGVSLRGIDPTRVLVLVDGERIVGRVDGAIDLSQISLESVDRIEVVKGVGSTLYGSEAIGGVVNIITKQPNGARRLSSLSDFGSFATFTQTVEGEARLGGWSLLLGNQFDRTDGFDLIPETPHTNGLERIKKYNFNAKATRQFGRGLSTVLKGSFFAEGKNWIESEYIAPRTYSYDDTEDNYRYSGSGKLLYSPNAVTYLDFNLYGSFYDHTWKKYFDTQLLDLSHTEDMLLEASATAWHEYTPDHIITAGGDVTLQSLTSDAIEGEKQEITGGDVYMEYQWKPSDLLSVLPGARFETHSTYGDHVTGSINVMVTPHRQLRFRSSYAGGFRAPSIKELYFRFDHSAAGYLVEGGGEDLKPETSRNFSATVEYNYGGIGQHRLTYFYNHLDNLIEFDWIGESETYWRGMYRYSNVFRAYTRGIEWQSVVKPTKNLRTQISYTWLTARNLETGYWLLNRPEHSLTIRQSVMLPKHGLELTAWASYYSKKLWTPLGAQNDFDSEIWAPERHEINLAVSKRLWDYFQLFARVENITDVTDAEYGYWPGRSFHIGLKILTDGNDNQQQLEDR